MNTSLPKVSVIIPTYNRAEFIGDAVQSVLNQAFEDFELIVIDDGSSDHTGEIIGALDSIKLKYIYQPNKGRSNARNHALSLAKGEYIAFLDSDDLYLPDKLQKQVDYMDLHPEYGMIYTSAYCIDEKGVALEHFYEASASGWLYKQIAFFVPVTITLPTVMVRREVFDSVGNFDEVMERFEDTDMWRRISKRYQIGALGEPTCALRTHTGNALAAQDPGRLLVALDYYIKKIRKEDRDVGLLTLRKGIAKLYGYYGAAMMSKPEWKTYGYAFLFKGIASWPFNLRIMLRLVASFVAFHTYRRTFRWFKTNRNIK